MSGLTFFMMALPLGPSDGELKKTLVRFHLRLAQRQALQQKTVSPRNQSGKKITIEMERRRDGSKGKCHRMRIDAPQ